MEDINDRKVMNNEPISVKEKMKEATNLAQDIVKDIYSKAKDKAKEAMGKSDEPRKLIDLFNKGKENKTTILITSVIVFILTIVLLIVRWSNESFFYSLFALLLPIGYFRPKIEKKTLGIILAVSLILFIIVCSRSYYVHFYDIFTIILIYILGECFRYGGWTLGGFLSNNKNYDSEVSTKDNTNTNSLKHKLIIIAVIVIALAIFLPFGTGGGSSGGGDYYDWESSKEEINDYGRSSASGTYSWSQGPLYLSITISGDRWYSSANFDVVSGGRIRNKTLYDESGAAPLGRIISSKSISYGNTILYKE
jgi:uncharacterized membrane protein YgcG